MLKKLPANVGDVGSIPWVRKSPWRMKWQPTLIFLSEKSHGRKSLAGYSPWGRKRVKHDLATKWNNKSQVTFVMCSDQRIHWKCQSESRGLWFKGTCLKTLPSLLSFRPVSLACEDIQSNCQKCSVIRSWLFHQDIYSTKIPQKNWCWSQLHEWA